MYEMEASYSFRDSHMPLDNGERRHADANNVNEGTRRAYCCEYGQRHTVARRGCPLVSHRFPSHVSQQWRHNAEAHKRGHAAAAQDTINSLDPARSRR